jgi:hypothetical protein
MESGGIPDIISGFPIVNPGQYHLAMFTASEICGHSSVEGRIGELLRPRHDISVPTKRNTVRQGQTDGYAIGQVGDSSDF